MPARQQGHSVSDDRKGAVGRHLAKLFSWFSWNLLPGAMGHKSGMQMPPTFNSHFPLLMTNLLIGWDPYSPTLPFLPASSGMALCLSAPKQHCAINEKSLQT